MKTQKMIKEYVAKHYGKCEVVFSEIHKGIGAFIWFGGGGRFDGSLFINIVYRFKDGFITSDNVYGQEFMRHHRKPEILRVTVEETMQYGNDYRITVSFGERPYENPSKDLPKSLFFNDPRSIKGGD